MARIDLTGQKFNKLTVLERGPNGRNRQSTWYCQCDCGAKSLVPGSELVSGRIRSCGCLRKETLSSRRPYNFIDLTGVVFGRLTVIGVANKKLGTTWLCKCQCGNSTEVVYSNLKSGRQLSCGCYNRDVNKQNHITHGLSKTGLYKVWIGIIVRCYNSKCESYPDYGGRGIDVCEEWKLDFMSFYNWAVVNGWKRGLQIDRYPDNNSGYRPGNCRLATPKENNNNKRNNVFATIDGVTKTAAQWAEETGVSIGMIAKRIKNGKTGVNAVYGEKYALLSIIRHLEYIRYPEMDSPFGAELVSEVKDMQAKIIAHIKSKS